MTTHDDLVAIEESIVASTEAVRRGDLDAALHDLDTAIAGTRALLARLERRIGAAE